MNNNCIILILVIILVLITGCSETVITTDDFAKCLTEKGAKMYGTSWCGHCKNQKALFGDSF